MAQMVKGTAKIHDRPFPPVQFIGNLHFKIDQGAIVQIDIDIQTKFLIGHRFSQYNGICDFHGYDFLLGEMQEGADQTAEYAVVGL